MRAQNAEATPCVSLGLAALENYPLNDDGGHGVGEASGCDCTQSGGEKVDGRTPEVVMAQQLASHAGDLQRYSLVGVVAGGQQQIRILTIARTQSVDGSGQITTRACIHTWAAFPGVLIAKDNVCVKYAFRYQEECRPVRRARVWTTPGQRYRFGYMHRNASVRISMLGY